MKYFDDLRNQRGDTIIEVLVVLAVLGLAITISYATAQRSLLAARQAQESSEGSVLLKSQVEKLRAMAPTSTDGDHAGVFWAGPYCIKEDTTASHNYSIVNLVANPADTDCVLKSDGTPGCATEPCYTITIKDDTLTDTFTLKATWDDVAGEGQDSVTTVYRVHEAT